MKEKLKHLLDLCIDKGLIFQWSSNIDMATVYGYEKDKGITFTLYSYPNPNSELHNYEDENTIHIDKLIKKIEEYER